MLYYMEGCARSSQKGDLCPSSSDPQTSPSSSNMQDLDELTERALKYQMRRCPLAAPSLEELRSRWGGITTNRSICGRKIL